eukprot:gb/GFBE01006398.1/.p1 GENE.gb/GFBE01006398.1/~~gb/GFBE01006398.1/.p1  ORF type:complete len:239 (+),score=52.59 gb/GFBE01006398.1/:1-717(+)
MAAPSNSEDEFVVDRAEAVAPMSWKFRAGVALATLATVGAACTFRVQTTGKTLALRGLDTVTLDEAVEGNVFKSDGKGYVMITFGAGTACHKHSDQEPESGTTLQQQSLAACKSACASDTGCKGLEYSHSSRTCEVWKEPVKNHVHVFQELTVGGEPDQECIVKDPTCADLKAHQKVVEAAVAKHAEFVAENCKDGPVDEPYSKCSKDYSEGLLGASSATCKAANEACSESQQCISVH